MSVNHPSYQQVAPTWSQVDDRCSASEAVDLYDGLHDNNGNRCGIEIWWSDHESERFVEPIEAMNAIDAMEQS